MGDRLVVQWASPGCMFCEVTGSANCVCRYREPTAADLVAWLQARPDELLAVAARLRDAKALGSWGTSSTRSWRRLAPHGGPGAEVWRTRAGWAHRHCLATEPLPAVYATSDEAKAAEDAALVAAGWALAGGSRG